MKRALIFVLTLLAIGALATMNSPKPKDEPNPYCRPIDRPELWPRSCLSRATTDQRVIDAWERQHGERL